MKGHWGKIFVGVFLLVTMFATNVFAAPSLEERKAELRQKVNSTLTLLYKKEPIAKKAVEEGAGYAVFANSGYRFGLFGSGHGRGMAVNNSTGQEVYMLMKEYNVGLGLGAKEYAVVFVFLNDKAWQKFTSSNWKVEGQATAAATDGVVGEEFKDATKVGDGIWAFQMTTKGITVELDLKGTNYYKDSSYYPKK